MFCLSFSLGEGRRDDFVVKRLTTCLVRRPLSTKLKNSDQPTLPDVYNASTTAPIRWSTFSQPICSLRQLITLSFRPICRHRLRLHSATTTDTFGLSRVRPRCPALVLPLRTAATADRPLFVHRRLTRLLTWGIRTSPVATLRAATGNTSGTSSPRDRRLTSPNAVISSSRQEARTSTVIQL